MNDINQKLKILLVIAELFNKENITWAVGGSTLLFLKDIVKTFNDIDIMVSEKDIKQVKELLLDLGDLSPFKPSINFKTKHFLEFNIDGVDVDIMAGFVIVYNNKDHYFPLEKKDIHEYLELNGIKIPLQSIVQWKKYYKLMGRKEKVQLIKEKFLK